MRENDIAKLTEEKDRAEKLAAEAKAKWEAAGSPTDMPMDGSNFIYGDSIKAEHKAHIARFNLQKAIERQGNK